MYPEVKCLLTWCFLTVEATMNKHIIQLSMVAMETNYSLILKRKGYHLSPNRNIFRMGTISDQSTIKVLLLFSSKDDVLTVTEKTSFLFNVVNVDLLM